VLVNVIVPRRLSDEQRAMLEQFDASANEETYGEDEGFFRKLKRALR
jgi:DnaJ-class molecular chaperone